MDYCLRANQIKQIERDCYRKHTVYGNIQNKNGYGRCGLSMIAHLQTVMSANKGGYCSRSVATNSVSNVVCSF